MSPERQLIDWHTHVWKPDHMTAQAHADMQNHGVVVSGAAAPEDHKREVADGGADKFVVINAPVRSYKKVPNDFIADYVARYPDRAVGFASVDPNDPASAEDFERSVTDLGLHGLKLSPVYQAFDPWSPRAWELYHLANKYDVPVMFHMGGMYDPNGTLEWGHVFRLDKVGRAFPDLRIIVAHFGQPNMQETALLMRKNKNVFTDLSARFRRKWQLYNGLLVAMEYKVTDRILFGSDFPVMTTMEAAEAFKNINDWGEGINLPKIPPELIDEIIYNRPFDLLRF